MFEHLWQVFAIFFFFILCGSSLNWKEFPWIGGRWVDSLYLPFPFPKAISIFEQTLNRSFFLYQVLQIGVPNSAHFGGHDNWNSMTPFIRCHRWISDLISRNLPSPFFLFLVPYFQWNHLRVKNSISSSLSTSQVSLWRGNGTGERSCWFVQWPQWPEITPTVSVPSPAKLEHSFILSKPWMEKDAGFEETFVFSVPFCAKSLWPECKGRSWYFTSIPLGGSVSWRFHIGTRGRRRRKKNSIFRGALAWNKGSSSISNSMTSSSWFVRFFSPSPLFLTWSQVPRVRCVKLSIGSNRHSLSTRDFGPSKNGSIWDSGKSLLGT